MKRNYDKHTSADEAKMNILSHLASNTLGIRSLKSTLGYAAFPDYNFRWPQGAAFAVAKIVSDLEKEKLVTYSFGGHGIQRGYGITQKGRNYLTVNACRKPEIML